jgi:hypothetical protein
MSEVAELPEVPGADEVAELLEALAAHVRENKIAHFEVRWVAGSNVNLSLCLYDPYAILKAKP